METKSKFAENLLEVLKENQKTLNHVIRLSGEPVEEPMQKLYQPPANGSAVGSSVTISEVLEKMAELIELNKVTLQTIDLLDKRIKRLHSILDLQMAKSQPYAEEKPVEEQAEEYTG